MEAGQFVDGVELHRLCYLASRQTSLLFKLFFLLNITNLTYPLNIAASIVFMIATVLLGGFFVKELPYGLVWLRYLVITFIIYIFLLSN